MGLGLVDATAEVFDQHLDRWRARQTALRGRSRYRVVAETLSRTCEANRPGTVSVLDVDAGGGADAIPLALAGHVVTVVDHSAALLELARAAAVAAGVVDRMTLVHAGLAALGLRIDHVYGIRCVTDLIAEDARKSEPAFYDELERRELELCDRPDSIGTARFWQVVARRPA